MSQIAYRKIFNVDKWVYLFEMSRSNEIVISLRYGRNPKTGETITEQNGSTTKLFRCHPNPKKVLKQFLEELKICFFEIQPPSFSFFAIEDRRAKLYDKFVPRIEEELGVRCIIKHNGYYCFIKNFPT